MTANKALAIIMFVLVISAVLLTYHRMIIKHNFEVIDDTEELESGDSDF